MSKGTTGQSGDEEQFDTVIYTKISIDDLVVYALYDLVAKGAKPSFENLVAHSFALFPKRFMLPGYPDYPDSLQINRSWVRCRTDKRLIEGSAAKGFKLTVPGLEVARRTMKRLRMSKEDLERISRTKEERLGMVDKFVKHVEDSTAYRVFNQTGKLTEVSDYDFAGMLMCSLDAPKRVLVENLEVLMSACEEVGRKDLTIFLGQCKEAFRDLLKEPRNEEFAGGMLKRRK